MASTVGSHAGTLDLTGGNDPEHIEANHPDSSRRYGANQRQSTIAGCIVVIALFAGAVALGAVSLQQSSEALELANANAKAIESENINANPVPSAGNEASPPTPSTDSAPKPTPEPSTARPTPTDAPTEPHPLNPQWFQTTHADWQQFNDANADRTGDDKIHSWSIAWMVCNKQDLETCSYDVYCPKGKGSGPFHGGPPKVHNWDTLEETQWAPYGPATSLDEHISWVQIGRIEESDGEFEESNYGQCWKYDEFYSGDGMDIEKRWGEEHRMWMLCCEKADEGGDARK